MATVCAIDVGTTRIKAMILGEDLLPGPVVSGPSVLSTPLPGAAEVDAEALWSRILNVLQQAASASTDIAALVITNQRATIFPLDEAAVARAPGLSWQDTRGQQELDAWIGRVGRMRFAQVTGLVPSTVWSVAKMLWWLREGMPSGTRFATVQDWLLRRLGAADWVIDHADASLTGLLNLRSLQWEQDLAKAAGLRSSQLSSLAASATQVGRIDPQVARLTGLPPGARLILGGGDQQCADLAAGVLESGVVAANLGTAGVIDVVSDRPVVDPRGRLVCVVHVVPGRWIIEGLENSYGGTHGWGEKILGERLTTLAAGAPVGSHGLLCFPYLAGMGAPGYESAARAALLGLTLAHGRQDVARALLEGTTIELVRILEAAGESVEVRRVVASGGGARSDLLLQMLADLANLPVAVAPHPETTLLGAGLLGWVGLGLWPDPATAAAALPPSAITVDPDPGRVVDYHALLDRYQSALDGLRLSGLLTLSREENQGDSSQSQG